MTGHPLVDGNKRLGWVAVRLFYLQNGADIRPAADDAMELVVNVADGTICDVVLMADRLRSCRSM